MVLFTAAGHYNWQSFQTDDQKAEEYFDSRPTLSKLGAWASDQSKDLDSREPGESFFKGRGGSMEIIHPNHHTGEVGFTPKSIEFWQEDPIVYMIGLFTNSNGNSWTWRGWIHDRRRVKLQCRSSRFTIHAKGKPFSDWKEERKYQGDKWGMQGKELSLILKNPRLRIKTWKC